MIRIFFLILFSIQIISSQSIKKSSLRICDKFLQANNCYYFSCIDSIYQCGKENILVQFSYPFCKHFLLFFCSIKRMKYLSGDALFERSYKSLTRPGQVWTEASQICLMQELNYFLAADSSVTCAELDRFVLNRYPICLTESHQVFSICSIICQNLMIFFDIFDNWILQGLNIKRLLLETAKLCHEKSQMEYVIDIGQSNIRTVLWSL